MSLQVRGEGYAETEPDLGIESGKHPQDDRSIIVKSCTLCSVKFLHVGEQRDHAKSDWHRYNLSRKLKGQDAIDESGFEDLIKDRIDDSISGSDTSHSDSEEHEVNDMLSTNFRKQATVRKGWETPDTLERGRKSGTAHSPLIWFSSPLLPSRMSLGAYRALFTKQEQEGNNAIEALQRKQVSAVWGQSHNRSPSAPDMFLCMVGGGHFAAMIVSLIPNLTKRVNGVEERQATIIAHKTFHRYITRRKQGGSQSANDSAKGAAHSAGAGIRRHNEAALSSEIRTLLADWSTMISQCQLLFFRATGKTNQRMLFGPYEDQVLHSNDSRIRSFPFTTRRATAAELKRAFIELTRMKSSQVTEPSSPSPPTTKDRHTINPQIQHAASSEDPSTKQVSKEEETAILHTSQLQALIRRSKASAVIAYLTNNSLSPNFIFHPPNSHSNYHAPTPLHLASSLNASVVILSLLTKVGADPTVTNHKGRVPFDITGDRSARDAFRVARFELGETRWSWTSAHCPPPISKMEASSRAERDRKEVEMVEVAQRKLATDLLERKANGLGTGSILNLEKSPGEKSALERREQEGRGLTPEIKARLEREKRARAAEERLKHSLQK